MGMGEKENTGQRLIINWILLEMIELWMEYMTLLKNQFKISLLVNYNLLIQGHIIMAIDLLKLIGIIKIRIVIVNFHLCWLKYRIVIKIIINNKYNYSNNSYKAFKKVKKMIKLKNFL